MSNTDDELAADLAELAPPEKNQSRSPKEERIIAGFEEIQRFVADTGALPQHGEERDIFERIYAVRLDRLRSMEECRQLLEPIDHGNLLQAASTLIEEPTVDDLVDELAELEQTSAITDLRYVRPVAEKRAAEEIANRDRCEDFHNFKPLFEQVQKDLDNGIRQTRPFERKAEIETGSFFIIGGQKAYIAEVGEFFTQEYGFRDARMRVVFDNGTQSNLLMRSLQRALHRDVAGRRISDPAAGPLFSTEKDETDTQSGTIYVLRSKSDHPQISPNRNVIHKIGVTGTNIESRVANAKLDPTFLMADVEVIATYDLYDINRVKLENLIHRFFADARLDIEITDRFGNPVKPREWFLVPFNVIDELVGKLQDGTIADFEYHAPTVSLKKLET